MFSDLIDDDTFALLFPKRRTQPAGDDRRNAMLMGLSMLRAKLAEDVIKVDAEISRILTLELLPCGRCGQVETVAGERVREPRLCWDCFDDGYRYFDDEIIMRANYEDGHQEDEAERWELALSESRRNPVDVENL